MNTSSLSTISDPRASPAEVLRAIQELGDAKEGPDFWRNIANNEDYRYWHRCQSIRALLRRHVNEGMSLSEFARLIDNPAWVLDNDVEIIAVLGGGVIPVTFTLEDTVFVLRLFCDAKGEPCCAIYLRVSGHIARRHFLSAIRGDQIDDRTAKASILEAALWPP